MTLYHLLRYEVSVPGAIVLALGFLGLWLLGAVLYVVWMVGGWVVRGWRKWPS